MAIPAPHKIPSNEVKLIILSLACLFLLYPAPPAQCQVKDGKELIAAVNKGSPGDKVQVAKGTFKLTTPLVPKANMTIQGAGPGKTIIMAADSWKPGTADLPKKENVNAYLFSFQRKTPGVKICDLTLQGPHLHGAIYCDNCDGLELCNLRVENFLWNSIKTWRMDKFKVHDCEFIDAGGRINRRTSGALVMHFTRDSEFWNNRIIKTENHPSNFFGIVGRQGRNCRIHHNTVGVSFSIEFAFYNSMNMEVDHNYFAGVMSIPRFGGGKIPEDGYSFWIHHNWVKNSYAIEYARNAAKIDHNLFDIPTSSDKGNLITNHGSKEAPGPTHFHNNLIKNPGRGIFWSKGIYNNFRFYNNHVKANTLTRKEGLFGFPRKTDFRTIVIRDNIIECIKANPRPLMRNKESYAATIEKNKLVNVSDTDSYANKKADRPVGLLKPLHFTCGVNDEFVVDGWTGSKAKRRK